MGSSPRYSIRSLLNRASTLIGLPCPNPLKFTMLVTLFVLAIVATLLVLLGLPAWVGFSQLVMGALLCLGIGLGFGGLAGIIYHVLLFKLPSRTWVAGHTLVGQSSSPAPSFAREHAKALGCPVHHWSIRLWIISY